VRATLYKPPPCYDDKILIKGLKSTKDALFLFLEATANVEPIRLDPHEEDDSTVLVTLKEKPSILLANSSRTLIKLFIDLNICNVFH
jgi:hypothetical protein